MAVRPFAPRSPTPMPGWGLSFGIMLTTLSVIVLVPMTALLWRGFVGFGLSEMWEQYPPIRLSLDTPKLYAPLNETQIRFSHYLDEQARFDFFYLVVPDDLTDDASSVPLIPLNYRHILADMATFFVMTDKEEQRAVGIGAQAKAGILPAVGLTAGVTRSDLDIALPDGTDDAAYLGHLDAALDALFARFDPQLIIYLAGADPHEGDRLGRLKLTWDGLEARDRRVFDWAWQRRLPVAFAMAGGYGHRIEDTVQAQMHTFQVACQYWRRWQNASRSERQHDE